ncbi:MAG: Yip1 family protein [Litorivicinaceae bacterium]|nr:YIP1 family protein [Litorivicinus sp.]MDA8665305.1 YIP1 family protein [Litorivicinaceae bacterium]MBL6824928.1 YIP1 family protein [Litorivicinus sp.]MDB2411817.1 YIP1 family protein [Litorivicinaceae bacterium]MDC1076280.1 Yip1 family protein [Litorivicinus sp.]
MYFGHIAGILKDPKNEWALIEEEHYSAKTVFLTQISILAAIPAIALYIGVTQVGWSVAGQEPVRLASSSALGSAVLFYFAMWGAVAFIAACMHWMEKTYGGEVSLDECLVLTTVTATPLFLSGISFLLPILWLNVAVAGAALVYSVYLLYSGTSRVMKIDEDRAFMFASSVLTVALCTLVGMLAASVIAWSHFVPLVYLP